MKPFETSSDFSHGREIGDLMVEVKLHEKKIFSAFPVKFLTTSTHPITVSLSPLVGAKKMKLVQQLLGSFFDIMRLGR